MIIKGFLCVECIMLSTQHLARQLPRRNVVGTTGEPLPSGTAVGADVLRWDHVGLNVADLDRASAWYEQVLGLRSEREFAVPGTGLRGRMLVHSSGYRLELI